MLNIAKKKLGWETYWDSVKFTWDSTFVDALGPRDPIEIKPKSNTAVSEKSSNIHLTLYLLRKFAFFFLGC